MRTPQAVSNSGRECHKKRQLSVYVGMGDVRRQANVPMRDTYVTWKGRNTHEDCSISKRAIVDSVVR
jgi:hypothetical protein